MRRTRAVLLAIGIVLLASLLSAAAWAASLRVDLPEPSGPHAVGRVQGEFDADDGRRVAYTAYHPAVAGTGTAGAYMPAAIEDGTARRDLGALRYLPDAWSHVHLPARDAADWPAGRFPLVVFSPGADVQPEYYSSLLSELASHGHVVAALAHPGTTPFVAYPDGSSVASPEPARPASEALAKADHEARIAAVAADVSAAVDALLGDSRLSGRLDGRVAAIGHSLGGAAAAEAALADASILAVADLDGSLGPGAGSTPLARPVLLVEDAGPTDAELAARGLTRERYEALPERAARRAFVDGGDPGRLVVVEGGTHMTFATDTGFLEAARPFGDRPALAPQDALRTIADPLLDLLQGAFGPGSQLDPGAGRPGEDNSPRVVSVGLP